MKTKTFEELLTRNASKEVLEELREMAELEIVEWENFIELCNTKLTNLHLK